MFKGYGKRLMKWNGLCTRLFSVNSNLVYSFICKLHFGMIYIFIWSEKAVSGKGKIVKYWWKYNKFRKDFMFWLPLSSVTSPHSSILTMSNKFGHNLLTLCEEDVCGVRQINSKRRFLLRTTIFRIDIPPEEDGID